MQVILSQQMAINHETDKQPNSRGVLACYWQPAANNRHGHHRLGKLPKLDFYGSDALSTYSFTKGNGMHPVPSHLCGSNVSGSCCLVLSTSPRSTIATKWRCSDNQTTLRMHSVFKFVNVRPVSSDISRLPQSSTISL